MSHQLFHYQSDLKVLEEIIISGKTPAEKLLDDYNNLWDKNITQFNWDHFCKWSRI